MSDHAAVTDRVELTAAGRERLQTELDDLHQIARPALIERIRHARLFLDPAVGVATVRDSERDLATVDARIAEIEAILANARPIGEGPPATTVQPGFPVTIRFDDRSTQTLTIVSPLEADPARGLISNESPAGRALLGKAPGATVNVDADGQSIVLQVEKVGAASETA